MIGHLASDFRRYDQLSIGTELGQQYTILKLQGFQAPIIHIAFALGSDGGTPVAFRTLIRCVVRGGCFAGTPTSRHTCVGSAD